MIRVIAVLATSIPLFSPIILRNNIFSNVNIFPMVVDNQYTIDFTYHLTPGVTAKISVVHEYLRRTQTLFSEEIISTGDYQNSFLVTAKRGSTITMKAQTENQGTAIYEFDLNVSNALPYIDFNETNVFNNQNAYIQINKDGKLNIYNEKATFHNFNTDYELPNSLYFDINQLGISYESNYHEIISASAVAMFGIIDQNNIFPRLMYSESSNAKMLALELVEEEYGNIKLKFKNKLFVDKTTRMMSLTQEEGFIETSRLYFPVNHHEDINGLEFFIAFRNFGILQLDFTLNATFRPSKKIIGDCLTSSFCVTSEETDLVDNDVLSEVYYRD